MNDNAKALAEYVSRAKEAYDEACASRVKACKIYAAAGTRAIQAYDKAGRARAKAGRALVKAIAKALAEDLAAIEAAE